MSDIATFKAQRAAAAAELEQILAADTHTYNLNLINRGGYAMADDWRLTTTPNSTAIEKRLASLDREIAACEYVGRSAGNIAPSGAVAHVPETRAPAAAPVDRASGIRRIGAALGSSHEAIDMAIARGIAIAEFAASEGDRAAAARAKDELIAGAANAAEARAVAEDETVARIIGDPTLPARAAAIRAADQADGVAPAVADPDDETEDAVVRRILES